METIDLVNSTAPAKPLCSFTVNYSCWRSAANELNDDYALLMAPVIGMMFVFMIVGLIGNAFVMTIYLMMKQKTTAQIFMLSLAIIDLSNCLIIHPYIIFKIFHNHDQTWAGSCKVFEFLGHTNLGLSGLTLLLVAIDRYTAICRPVKFLTFKHTVSKMIICTTCVAFLFSSPILEFYGSAPYVVEVEDITLVRYLCHYQHKYERGSPVMFTFSLFILGCFIVEVIALVVLYWLVALTAYRSRRSIMPLPVTTGVPTFEQQPSTSISFITSESQSNTGRTFPSNSPPHDIPEVWPQRLIIPRNLTKTPAFVHRQSSDQRDEKAENKREIRVKDLPYIHTSLKRHSKDLLALSMKRKERTITNRYIGTQSFKSRLKAAKMLFLVTAVFFGSYMPFFVLRIIYAIDNDLSKDTSRSRQVLEHLLNHFFYLNNTINPIIYTLINSKFRQECKRLLRKRCRCCQ